MRAQLDPATKVVAIVKQFTHCNNLLIFYRRRCESSCAVEMRLPRVPRNYGKEVESPREGKTGQKKFAKGWLDQ